MPSLPHLAPAPLALTHLSPTSLPHPKVTWKSKLKAAFPGTRQTHLFDPFYNGIAVFSRTVAVFELLSTDTDIIDRSPPAHNTPHTKHHALPPTHRTLTQLFDLSKHRAGGKGAGKLAAPQLLAQSSAIHARGVFSLDVWAPANGYNGSGSGAAWAEGVRVLTGSKDRQVWPYRAAI